MAPTQSSARVSPEDPAYAGQADYTPALLRVYDLLILGLANRALWRCPASRVLDLYNENVSASHLDVGPGTGYFLDRCRFPDPRPEITLLDLNAEALRFAARRIERYTPRNEQANILEPLALGTARFGSIGMAHLLHCLPGTMATKGAAFRNLKPYLREGGTVFGSTVLAEGVPHTALSRRAMRALNRRGTFTNLNDDLNGLERILDEEFVRRRLDVCGSVALFAATA